MWVVKSKMMEKIYNINVNQKKATTAMLMSDKVEISDKSKKITKHKEEYYIIIRGSIQQEDTSTLNISAPNNDALKYIKQKWPKVIREIDKPTINF